MKTITLTNGTKINFDGGAHSPEDFAAEFCARLFELGALKQYPGADFYAIGYGELCAYSNQPDKHGHPTLLAIHSESFPDTPDDMGRFKTADAWAPHIATGEWLRLE